MKEVSGKAFDFALFKRTFAFAWPYRKTVLFTGLMIVMVAFLGPLRPLLIQYTIDEFVVNFDVEGLTRMTAILVGLLLVEACLQFFQTYYASWLGQHVIKDLRLKTYQKIIGFKNQYFDQNPIGRLVTRVVSDIETISEIFSQGLLIIFGDILKLLVVLAFMFATDWRLSLYSLIPIPILIFATGIFKRAIKTAFQEVRTQVSNLNSFVQEHVTGMSIVQLFNREQTEFEKFKVLNRKHRTAHIKTIWAYSIFFPVVELLSAMSLAALVWWGAGSVIGGTVSMGNLVAFILYIHMLFRPIRELADRFNTLQMGMVSSERVFKILDTEAQIEDNGKIEVERFEGRIEFNDMWFAYNTDDWILKNINLKVNPGETLALVGSTGSGKSSMINVLGRYYEFQKGRVNIDGKDIRGYSLNSLRNRMAVVQQDVLLFSDSIFNNITLYNPNVSMEKVVEASKAVGAHDFISALPGAYDYNVRERGAMLSVGQRQLISFIRAYVSNPDILVLDEATSSIDTMTEELIQKSTETLTEGRTSIIIAHRLSTIKNADRIAVLQHGEIVEVGSHDELMERNGHYRKYYEIQFKKEASLLS